MAADDAAVVVTLRANLKDYEAALKSAVRSTERAAKASEQALSGIGKKASAAPIAVNFQKSAGQIANDARVLQYQLNDIFSGVASGQGIRAVQMQLGQISQQLGGQGLGAAARTMGAALVTMINPINLAVVAFGVAATAAASYFSSVDDGSEKATADLKKHLDALGDVVDRYKNAAPAAHAAIQEMRRVLQLKEDMDLVKGSVDSLSSEIREKLSETLARLGGVASELDLAKALGPTEAATAVEDLRKEFEALIDAVSKGKNPSLELTAVLQTLESLNIKAPNAGFLQLADTLKQDVLPSMNTLIEQHKALLQLQTSMHPINLSMPGAGGALDLGPVSGANRAALLDKSLGKAADAIDKFVERVIQAESGGSATAKNPLSSATGAGQFIDSTWLSVFKAHFAAEAEGMSDAAILALRTDVEANRRMIRAYATDNARLLTDAGQEVNEAALQLAHFLGAGGAIKVLSAAPGTRAADILPANVVAANQSILGGGATREDVLAYAGRRAGAQTREKENTQLEDWLRLSQQELDLKNQQLDINAQFWESQARRNAQMEEQRLIQEGLTAATEQYGTVTDEMRAKIEAAAHAQAFASVASEEAAERQKQFVESQKQNAQQIAQLNQLAQSSVSGLVGDLMNGVDAGEAFNRMLQNIIASLAQMAIQQIFNPAGSGSGGLLGMLFGAAQSGGIVGETAFQQRKVSPLVFAGAPRFAKGGMVGLRAGEIPIIAHRGEMIIPKAHVVRGGGGKVGGVTNNIGSIGVSVNTGPDRMVATTEDGKKLGLQIDRAVQMVMVRESRPGGLLRRVPA